MKNKLTNSIYKEFVYGGHFQSLGAACVVLTAFILLNIKIKWPSLILAYLIFYPLYLFNRLWELDNDKKSNQERTDYFLSYINLMPLIFAFESLVMVVLIYFMSPSDLMMIFSLLLYILGAMYTIFVKKLTKYIFAFKNMYVALFFASLVPWTVLFANEKLSLKVWFLTLYVFIKGVLMQIILDIKDVESDKNENLKTVVCLLGKSNAVSISLIFIILISLLIPFYFVFFNKIFSVVFLFNALSIIYYIFILKEIKKEKYVGYILMSGEYLLWAILIFLGNIII